MMQSDVSNAYGSIHWFAPLRASQHVIVETRDSDVNMVEKLYEISAGVWQGAR